MLPSTTSTRWLLPPGAGPPSSSAAPSAIIDETDEAGDPDTADLFTEISRTVDKQLWFLEAHVRDPTGDMRDGKAAA